MQKEKLLNELSKMIGSGELTRGEVFTSFGHPLEEGVGGELEHKTKHKTWLHFSVTKMLYVFGAAIVTLGILFFIAQIWEDIGAFGRIAVTLLLGFILAGSGTMLLKKRPNESIGLVFHGIGGFLIPGGAVVTLSELSTSVITLWPVTLVIGGIFIFYLFLSMYHKNALLTFFVIANGTAFIYLFAESVLDGPFYKHADFYAYLTMVLGISYLLLAKVFIGNWNSKLTGLLFFFGITGFLGALFSLIFDNKFWEFTYSLFAISGVLLSVYLRSRSILAMSTIFFIGYIIYITQEYFANSLGWPITLILLGFVFIGLGYVSISINKKYIKN